MSGARGSFADRHRDKISVTGRNGGERRLAGNASGQARQATRPHGAPRADMRSMQPRQQHPEPDYDDEEDYGNEQDDVYQEPEQQYTAPLPLQRNVAARGDFGGSGNFSDSSPGTGRRITRFVPAQQQPKHAANPVVRPRESGRKLTPMLPGGHVRDPKVAIYTSPKYAEREAVVKERNRARGMKIEKERLMSASGRFIAKVGEEDGDGGSYYEEFEEEAEYVQDAGDTREFEDGGGFEFLDTEAELRKMDHALGLDGVAGGSMGEGEGVGGEEARGFNAGGSGVVGSYAAAARAEDGEEYEEYEDEDPYYRLDRPSIGGRGASIGVGERFPRPDKTDEDNRRWQERRAALEAKAEAGDDTDRLAYGRKPRPVKYKPYRMDDFRQIRASVPERLGTLGPNVDDPEVMEKRKLRERLKNYERVIHERNLAEIELQSTRRANTSRVSREEVTRREKGEPLRRARDYARTVPKPGLATERGPRHSAGSGGLGMSGISNRMAAPQTDRGPRPRRSFGGSGGGSGSGNRSGGMGDVARQFDELEMRHKQDLAREREIRRHLNA